MTCQRCGATLLADARFCSSCGAPLATAPRRRVVVPARIAEKAEGFTGREWVLDEVANWLDQRSERFLLLTGDPGSGKTALAAWLAGAGRPPGDAGAQQ